MIDNKKYLAKLQRLEKKSQRLHARYKKLDAIVMAKLAKARTERPLLVILFSIAQMAVIGFLYERTLLKRIMVDAEIRAIKAIFAEEWK